MLLKDFLCSSSDFRNLKKHPSYSEKYKQRIVNQYRNGKASSEIFKEYGMSSSVFYKRESVSGERVNEIKVVNEVTERGGGILSTPDRVKEYIFR